MSTNLYESLHRQLVETGEWDRLAYVLQNKLSESGWLDELRNRARERSRGSNVTYKTVAEDMQVLGTTPPFPVRSEMVALIREALEQLIE